GDPVLAPGHPGHQRGPGGIREQPGVRQPAEVAQRDPQGEQRRTAADHQLPAVRVGHPEPPAGVGVDVDVPLAMAETPRLGVVHRRRVYRGGDGELDGVHHAPTLVTGGGTDDGGTGGGTGRDGGGSQPSQRGRYQLRGPSSFIVAGSRTARTTVASSSTATARPTPISLSWIVDRVAK